MKYNVAYFSVQPVDKKVAKEVEEGQDCSR